MPGKIAACVVLYNPEQSVEQNISSYINYVDKIYVMDNTETKDYNYRFLSVYQSEIIFIHNGKNEGVAKCLNEACNLSIKDGFDYLLTMDQDSYFDESSIARYFQCIENFDKYERVAMFGINYQYQTQKENCDFKKAKSFITSGSVINLSCFKTIGEFNENLFIDFVDTEYCFRSIQQGYEIIEFPNIFMHHEIGELSEQRSFKNLKSSKRSIHSVIRLYYMSRNFLYLNKKYKNLFSEQLQIHRKDLINRVKNKLLYHPNRYKTFQYLLKAFRDYKRNRMGKQL